MKKTIVFLVVAALVFVYVQDGEISPPWNPTPTVADSVLEDAFNNGQSDIQVRGQGTVVKILSDDLDGSRHQRFILKLGSGQTLLISHNIDLAPRVDGLRTGDSVEFFGEYEWNSKGGVVHWTHHDPNGRHVAGWLKHRGRTYQ
jgi:hypothetical protein